MANDNRKIKKKDREESRKFNIYENINNSGLFPH